MVWIIFLRGWNYACIFYWRLSSSRSFIGYASINSVLSEVRDPVRTIKLAAPLAMISVSAVYLFINISYYAVVSKTDILESQRIVALVIENMLSRHFFLFSCFYRALYFRNLFGPTTERVSFFCYTYCILAVLMPYTHHHRPLAPSLQYLLWATY